MVPYREWVKRATFVMRYGKQPWSEIARWGTSWFTDVLNELADGNRRMMGDGGEDDGG